MAVDYDLIVIGNSAAGIYAAIEAATLKARVALVVPDRLKIQSPELLDNRILQELRQAIAQPQWADTLEIGSLSLALKPNWAERVRQWSKAVAESVDTLYSPAVLASLGIEVIESTGEFCRKPKPGFMVNGRYVRSRAYLLATGCSPQIADIAGLDNTRHLTATTVFPAIDTLKPSHHLVIVGSDPVGVELAQTFAKFGLAVTLVVQSPRILPSYDLEVARLIQAQLEAEGIQILTNAAMTQVKQIHAKKWVQVGNQAIEADEILLATGWEPNVSFLNLEAFDLRPTTDGLAVNHKLQTVNPGVYACLGLINGNYAPHFAIAQAKVAVKNALFLPLSKIHERTIPHTIGTDPQAAQVGLTETQAREQYGQDVFTVRHSLQWLTKTHIRGEATGFCQFILRRNGEILGSQIVGEHAHEIIGTIALAIQQRLKIQTLARLTFPAATFAEVIHQTAFEWQRLRMEKNVGRQDFLEGFFNWQRSRLK